MDTLHAGVRLPIVLRAADIAAERPSTTDDDIHFTEALAESVIAHASHPGDLILDPFAGYGTTVAVAERMGRRAIGIELMPAHLEIARTRTHGRGRLILGDARELSRLVDEPVDLVLTSPPYMSTTPVPISTRLVLAPTAASSGNGDASCRAKWWTRK